MNLNVKSVICFLFLSIGQTIYGQSSSISHLDSTVGVFIHNLQNRGIDTIFVYKTYIPGSTYMDDGKLDEACLYGKTYSISYILWKKDGFISLTKKDNCFDYSPQTFQPQNKLWNSFFFKIHDLKKDDAKPFEYVARENKKEKIYTILKDHSRLYELVYFTQGKSIKLKIDEFDFEENSDGKKNINYQYNTRLKSWVLINEFKQIIISEELESKFTIPIKAENSTINKVNANDSPFYKVLAIDSLQNKLYVIYVQRGDSIFKVISKKDIIMPITYNPIRVGESVQLGLIRIFPNDELLGNQVSKSYNLHVKGIDFDGIIVEVDEKSNNALYEAINLRGLCIK